MKKLFTLILIQAVLFGNINAQCLAVGYFTNSGQNLGSSNSFGIDLVDLDGDGDIDAFVANYIGQANKVWLNDGDGNFTDSGQNLGSSNSYGIDLADLDGDGYIDAFVANYGQANKVWLNDGAGNFTDSGQNLGSSNSYGIDLADLDGDGDIDAFVANYNGQANKVWLNDGAGNFTDSGQNLGSSNSYGIDLADLDGDGYIDAFVANYGQANKVWLNDGAGNFTDSGQNLGSSNSYGIDLADLDGDGDIDAFVANYNGQANKVWLNDGAGNFTDSGQNLGSSNSYGIDLADLDGDGYIDAFVANNAQANKVWLNDTDLNLSFAATPANCDSICDGTAMVTVTSIGIPFSYLWDDPNAQTSDTAVGLCEGIYNVTVTNANNCIVATGGVAVYCTNPVPTCAGLFPSYTPIQGLYGAESTGVALGDLDGDGDLDAFIGCGQYGSAVICSNNGAGYFTISGIPQGTINSYRNVVLGDLDNDGDLDAVNGQQAFLNDGSGNFTYTGQTLSDVDNQLADLDGDGDIDLFNNAGEVWLNNGFALFTNSGQTFGYAYDEVNLADLDGDGDIDASYRLGVDHQLFFNDGFGVFTAGGIILTYNRLLSGDIDNDGDIDLVGETVWFNDGLGNFSDSWQDLNSFGGNAFNLGDFDGDGDLDILSPENLHLNNGSGYFLQSGQIMISNSYHDQYMAVGDVDGDGDLDMVYTDNSYEGDPSVVLNYNSPILSSSTATPTCNGFTNGTANVQVNVATAPYNYQWSNGATTSFVSGIGAGAYTVTVTDALGCSDSLEVVVTEPEIIIELDSLPNFYCGSNCEGGAEASASGDNGPFTYQWNDALSQTGTTATDLCEDTYTVLVTDGNGCTKSDSITISTQAYPTYPICLISVDSTSTKNLVVWEKPLFQSIDSVKIYREFGTGNYGLVGIVSNDTLSQFIDNSFGINPNITSYRYKISLLDSCGNESQVSPFHETMHLSTNLAPNGGVNLIWDAYEGFPVVYYRILRDSTFNNDWQVMDSVSNNSFIWTDNTPPTVGADYMVEVMHPNGCDADLFKATSYSSSRSNRSTSMGGGSAPIGNFTANITQVNPGGVIDFFDQSSNNPTSWIWYFSGGSPGFSTQQNPSAITYNTPGVYDVTLVVINALGIDTLVETGYIEVVPGTGLEPSCDFIASATQVPIGTPIDYLDLTQNNPTSWTWFFPGGNPAFSTSQSPLDITYNSAGTYDVTLITSNPSGIDTLIKTGYIEVLLANGLQEYKNGQVSIYPNPANDILNVELTQIELPCFFTLKDIQGRTIYSTAVNTQKLEVDISNYAKGIYLIRVNNANFSRELKLVKQ